jgi:hypothetical protein
MSQEKDIQEVPEVSAAEQPHLTAASETPADNLPSCQQDQELKTIPSEENTINDTGLTDQPGNDAEPKIRLWAGPRKGRALVKKEDTPHHVQHFERAKANELWQTDLFTFMLKRQNRRVHLV